MNIRQPEPRSRISASSSEFQIQSCVDAVRWRVQRTASQLEHAVVHAQSNRPGERSPSRRRRCCSRRSVSWCVPSVFADRTAAAGREVRLEAWRTGVCSSTLPMPVLSDGAAARRIVRRVAHTRLRSRRSAGRCRTRRRAPDGWPGVVFAPMKPVMSARAGQRRAPAAEAAAGTDDISSPYDTVAGAHRSQVLGAGLSSPASRKARATIKHNLTASQSSRIVRKSREIASLQSARGGAAQPSSARALSREQMRSVPREDGARHLPVAARQFAILGAGDVGAHRVRPTRSSGSRSRSCRGSPSSTSRCCCTRSCTTRSSSAGVRGAERAARLALRGAERHLGEPVHALAPRSSRRARLRRGRSRSGITCRRRSTRAGIKLLYCTPALFPIYFRAARSESATYPSRCSGAIARRAPACRSLRT